jgi:hypothetical protein
MAWCSVKEQSGWAPVLVWHSGEENNFQPLPGLEPTIMQPVSQRSTTELLWMYLQMRPVSGTGNDVQSDAYLSSNLY